MILYDLGAAAVWKSTDKKEAVPMLPVRPLRGLKLPIFISG
jgi:hypothetical protein